MNKKFGRVSLLAICLAGLAACGESSAAPQGQVIARVNGQDITLSELNAEMLASNVKANGDDKEAARAVLQRLIARKLLVETARDEGLDKNSEFILARQRSEENELAGLAQRQMLEAVERPTKEEVEAYIKANPEIFNNRKLMILEQIRFPQPANANDVKFLEAAQSLDQVAELLKQNAIKFERVPTVFDTTSVNKELASRIDNLPPGEVFIIANGQFVLANVIKEKRPAAIPADAALQYAAQLIHQERMSKAIEGQVDSLRKKAKITYQDGYSPAEKKGSKAKS